METYADKIAKSKITASVIIYLVAVGIAEMVVAYYSAETGLVIHAIILLSLLILSSYIREERFSMLLQSLAIAPLIRILSISIPLIAVINPIYQFLLIYLPLLIAAILFIRNNKMTADDLGITFKKLKFQILIGLTGCAFGVIEYFILKEYISIETRILQDILIYIFILIFFTGFIEELIFRGIILTNTNRIFSKNKSTIFVSLLFTVMHTGWKSPLDLLFVFAVSIFYCHIFLRTRNLIGISMAHGVTNVMEFIIVPLIYVYLIY